MLLLQAEFPIMLVLLNLVFYLVDPESALVISFGIIQVTQNLFPQQ